MARTNPRGQTLWKAFRKGEFGVRNSVSGNCLCAGSGLSSANTRLARTPAAVGRTAVERRPYHRTLRNAVVVGGWLKRRQDGGFPSPSKFTARPSRGGSAGRLAPPGNDGHAGRVTLPQRARYPAYPILPPPQITPVLLYYAHRKSRRKFNRSEAYEEVM